MSLRCRIGFHGNRDQGEVGYCERCGHFLPRVVLGSMWIKYVQPRPHDPMIDPPRDPVTPERRG